MEICKNMMVSGKENGNSFHYVLSFPLILMVMSSSSTITVAGFLLAPPDCVCALLTLRVLVFFHCGGFVCSTFTLLEQRKNIMTQCWVEDHSKVNLCLFDLCLFAVISKEFVA